MGNNLPGKARGWLGYVLAHLGDAQVLPLMEAAVEARSEIQASVNRGNARDSGGAKTLRFALCTYV